MDKNYIKDMLEDLKALAQHNDTTGIIAMCENEIELINKRSAKQDLIETLEQIEDARYEVSQISQDERVDKILEKLKTASTSIRNLILKNELNIAPASEMSNS
jgi:23S rRNA A1618 N6-methylase RlmF